MKRPIVVICLGYIIGILWGLYCKNSIVLLYVGIIFIKIILKLISNKKNKKFKIMSFKRHIKYLKIIIKTETIITIIVSSCISYLIVKNLNNKYVNLYKDIDKVEVVAVVIDNGTEKEYKDVYKIKVELLNNSSKYKNTKLLLNITSNIKLKYGDRIVINGEYIKPTVQRNYKGFDYSQYLKTQKIYGSINAYKIDIIDKNCNNYIFTISNKINLKIKENVKKFFSSKTSSIFLGIMLGDTTEINEEVIENFKSSNMSHILAVSGMHIAYIITGINIITKNTFGKRKTNIFLIIILIIYMFITNFSVSIVRASIMGIMALVSKVIYRKNDIWISICFSALILLEYNPFYIFSTSMLLTYGGTIGIIILNKNISDIIKIKKKEELKNIKDKIINNIKEIIGVSISAQIIIFPIIILIFNTINFSFLITSVLLGNVIGLVVILGFLQIIIFLINIQFSTVLVLIIEQLIEFINLISKIGARLPLNQIYVTTPSIISLILYYIIIYILNYLYEIYSKKKFSIFETRIKNYINLFKFLFNQKKNNIIVIILILSLIVFFIKIIPKELKVFFIDVGQGDCTLIVTPRDKTILIDGGGSQNYDVGENVLLPYLLDRNISKLDYIFISHFDQDHVGGITAVLNKIKVKKMVISEQIELTEEYEIIIKICKDKNIPVIKVKKNQKINIEKEIYIEVLFPTNKEIKENAINNNSLVLKFLYKNFSILFTGDIERIAEEEILNLYKESDKLKATVLKVAHHGSISSSISEFLNVVNPKIALIGVGKNNYGHPSDEVIERLKKLNAKIYRTDLNGEIVIYSNGENIKIKKFID